MILLPIHPASHHAVEDAVGQEAVEEQERSGDAGYEKCVRNERWACQRRWAEG
jgi:hypothetical protein